MLVENTDDEIVESIAVRVATRRDRPARLVAGTLAGDLHIGKSGRATR